MLRVRPMPAASAANSIKTKNPPMISNAVTAIPPHSPTSVNSRSFKIEARVVNIATTGKSADGLPIAAAFTALILSNPVIR